MKSMSQSEQIVANFKFSPKYPKNCILLKKFESFGAAGSGGVVRTCFIFMFLNDTKKVNFWNQSIPLVEKNSTLWPVPSKFGEAA